MKVSVYSPDIHVTTRSSDFTTPGTITKSLFTNDWLLITYSYHLICLSLQYYQFVEVAIRQCKSSGIDCKVHGLSIVGRLKSDDDDLGTTFSFLASDNEEEDEEEEVEALNLAKRLQPMSPKEMKTHVFAWGLNDKDQLGGPKGSKVRRDSTSVTDTKDSCV